MTKIIPSIFKTKEWEDIQKKWDKPPKVRIIPIDPEDASKAEIMEKLFEYQWPEIKLSIEEQMKVMIQKCILIGEHKWTGYGIKNRHICKRCGLKTSNVYDPKFDGSSYVYWDNTKSIAKELGKLGGEATKAKLGKEHFKRISKLGVKARKHETD